MSKSPSSVPLIRKPWFAFLSSMRFAVALLSLLGVASVIGTVLQQNQQQQPPKQEKSDGVAGWIKDMFGSN